jgi:type IV pilus assembly protein PilY1
VQTGIAVAAAAVACAGLTAPAAQAGAVISNGPVSLGLNDQGHLNFGGVGLALAGLGDGIFPGCLCEGWGVAGNGIAGWGSIDNGGISNLILDSFVSTPSTATSTVHLASLPDLQVIQAYAPAAGAPTALFEDKVTIKNNGAAPITGIRYRRVMDWDIPPTEFSEHVTIGGLPAANVLFSSDNGFATSNPLGGTGSIVGGTVNTNFVDSGPADHGALFDFGFGDLAAGESKMFSIFYGATTSEASAFAALGAVGAEVYSLGQSRRPDGDPVAGTPGTFIFAFKGVGGRALPPTPAAVPEPTSLALLGAGVLPLLRRLRRRPQADTETL